MMNDPKHNVQLRFIDGRWELVKCRCSKLDLDGVRMSTTVAYIHGLGQNVNMKFYRFNDIGDEWEINLDDQPTQHGEEDEMNDLIRIWQELSAIVYFNVT